MTDTGVYHLFVYGSLRKGFHSHAYEYISRFFTFVGDARVRGKLFDLGPYPAAIPTNEEFYIRGELYEIQDPAEFPWAIGQLDDYEGLNVEEGERPLYRRETVQVFFADSAVNAWIYWYDGDVEGKTLIPSGDILEYIRSKQ
jgi:gamma-glutamylcyclotransferase (GGCT)/AIG2-like uncharacterized protein YtfP